MKVVANVEIELTVEDLASIGEEVGDNLTFQLQDEIVKSIKESEAWKDMRRQIYNACLVKLREEIAKDWIEKIKGES